MFPKSTTGRYLPGVGMTLTRANIEAAQAERAKEGGKPLTVSQILAAFIPRCAMAKDLPYHPRLTARVKRLVENS